MPVSHLMLALLVVLVWGVNFLFVSLALQEIPPLLLCAIRFFLVSVPAIFFIKMPSGSFKDIALYGLVMFALQFAFLFIGMNVGMPPGMAALIVQVQVFFSMFFAVILLGESVHPWQVIGALISFAGVGVVALHFDHSMTLLGFICVLAASVSFGIGNLMHKKITHTNIATVIVWGSFVACFPMLILSLIFEGVSATRFTYEHLTWLGGLSVLYIVGVSTWIGYVVWNWLIRYHPVSTVVPFTLLVPVVGLVSSIVFLGEPFYGWKLMASLLVIGGLCINLIGLRLNLRKIAV